MSIKFLPKVQLLTVLLLSLSLRVFSQNSNLNAAKNHLERSATELNLSKKTIREMVVSNEYLSPTTGWYHVYFTQMHENIEVYNAVINVALVDGHVLIIGNRFIPLIENQIEPIQGFTKLSAEEAVGKAIQSLKLEAALKELKLVSESTNIKGETDEYTFDAKSVSSEPIVAKLLWFPYQKTGDTGKVSNTVAQVWSINLITPGFHNAWSVQVDAYSGEIVATFDDVITCNFGHKVISEEHKAECKVNNSEPSGLSQPLAADSYNIFDYPLESPIHGNRTYSNAPYTRFAPTGTGPGSTNGWHDDGSNSYNTTQGNNVHAQEDTNDDDSGGNRPFSSTRTFDYPYTQGLGTATGNQNAAITNLFYWNNLIHDTLWRLGFDEPSGNFQENNMSRGGSGSDFVFADAQDGSGTNNANFYTPSDGSNPRMQMFLWNVPSTYEADSDFDNAIIAHEYGHGWSTRLTGGASNVTCLRNVEQGGEGWSDYLGLMLTTDWASLSPNVASANIPRGIGTYVLGEATSGDGIRPYRYSYDIANINSAVTYAAVGNSSLFSQPHGIGSIWCTIIWDMTWEIILEDNAIEPDIFNTSNMVGNVAALKLVNEGLRLQPCSPSFVDARDAILAADQAFFNGKYRCAIGRAFARRGLGQNASTGTSSDDRVVTEDFSPIAGNALSSPLSLTVCSGEAFNYTATSNTAGTSFVWLRNPVAGISNPSASSGSPLISEALINTTTEPIVVTYNFYLTPSGCGSGGNIQQNFRVTVNPAATVPTVATYNICQNLTVPVGEGLIMPASTSTNQQNGQTTSSAQTYVRPFGSGSYYYEVHSYTAPTTGSVTFETTSGSFDTYLFLHTSNFDPTNPNSDLLAYNDDGGIGLLSKITYSVQQGVTYTVVVTSFWSGDTGSYTLEATNSGFGTTYNWYTSLSASTPIYTGSTFNPVGIAGSGIANTVAPISKQYFVSSTINDQCRATTTFTIDMASIESNLSGLVSENDTVCAIFNAGTLNLSGHSGNVIGWESANLGTSIWATEASSSTSHPYSGLVNSKEFRAVIDRGNCSTARSASVHINVITPMETLVNPVSADTAFQRVSLYITSSQQVDNQSKLNYQAGRNIQLNAGFEAANGSYFEAEIFDNDCFIPVEMSLQPDSTTGIDTDISSAFSNTNYATNRYMIPYAWTQFNAQETRRSLIKFDISSIPANAIIDSAFVSLFYSQRFVDDNPPFTGHFGSNSLVMKRVTQDWSDLTATWSNQPTVTQTNEVIIAAANSQQQDYVNIDVKALLNDQIANTNYGFMISHENENPYVITCLTSCEEVNAAKRPKLVVYYRYK